ncbi:MAG: CHASE2 domain-containing protein, partial [Phycisphaerales bacterium]|nr:CHASE2 domain-containing protein [Phycisphaerales bacterium]
YRNLEVVLLEDLEATEDVGRRVGLAEADSPLALIGDDDLYSFRLTHAHMIRRLVEAEARVIGIDMFFPNPSANDEPFGNACADAVEAGVPVVGIVATWDREVIDARDMVPALQDVIRYGRGTVREWSLDLLMERPGGASPMTSFALEVFAAWLHPDARMQPFVSERERRVELRFERQGVPVATESVEFTSLDQKGDAFTGIRDDDRMYSLILDVPTVEDIGSMAHPYHEVLTLGDEAFDDLFRDKLVLIANGITDIHQTPDGRRVPGVWKQASAIAQMMAGVTVRNVGTHQNWVGTTTLILVSMLVGMVCSRGMSRWIASIVVVMSIVAGSLILEFGFRYIVPPFMPSVVAVACIETSALVQRAVRQARSL